MPALSLLEVLAEVPDPRSRHGRVHPLPAILALTVLAMLRGCKGPVAIAQFGRDYGAPLAHALGFTRAKMPRRRVGLCQGEGPGSSPQQTTGPGPREEPQGYSLIEVGRSSGMG